MAEYHVTCVERAGKDHQSITHIGGPAGGGWSRAKAFVIASINVDKHIYYTEVDGKRANIGVNGTGQNQYLQTHADGVWSNNLLALPSCP